MIKTGINDFAYIPYRGDVYYSMLRYLERKILDEKWSFTSIDYTKRNLDTPILENYIKHTFMKLASERNDEIRPEEKNKRIYIDESIACFNTGLYDKRYKQVFGYFVKNSIPNAQEWVLKSFLTENSEEMMSIDVLPERARYFHSISDLVFDTNYPIRIDAAHILGNPVNVARIPDLVRKRSNLDILLEGAVGLAVKKIKQNYRVAIPQYFENRIQFLIPLSLTNMDKIDVVLAVSKHEGFYSGKTCLTLDMAYNNARLIAKPDEGWLASIVNCSYVS